MSARRASRRGWHALSLLGLLAVVVTSADMPWLANPVAAQADDAAEKEAFEAAKALGTVEAWDAFLSHYATGFRADLARAYVKKLADQPAAAPQPAAATPVYDYPMVAGSWGGLVRRGPGQGFDEVASLAEGEQVTLMAPPVGMDNGFPWFKISFRDDQRGFMWGGILCSTGVERPDLFKLCTFEPKLNREHDTESSRKARSDDDGDEPRKKKKRQTSDEPKRKTCASGRVLVDGNCVKRAYADTVCGPGYHRSGSKCVPGYRAPKPGTPLTPDQQQAVGKGCPKGQVWSKAEGCHEDD